MIRRSPSRFAIAAAAATLFALNQPARQFAQQSAQQLKQEAKQEKKQPDAQPPNRADQEPSVRISTQLVQIDVTVTDKKGEHVDNLTEDDFELSVDGKKQNITYFKLVKLPEPTRPLAPAAPAAKAPAPVAPPPSRPMKTIAPEHVVRTIAFVV